MKSSRRFLQKIIGAPLSKPYKYGLQPDVYFESYVLPTIEEFISTRDMSSISAYKLFETFISIDSESKRDQCSEDISSEELMRFCGIKSRIFERLLTSLAKACNQYNNRVDFKAFCSVIWNICTADSSIFAKVYICVHFHS